jgi:hypothetical protein
LQTDCGAKPRNVVLTLVETAGRADDLQGGCGAHNADLPDRLRLLHDVGPVGEDPISTVGLAFEGGAEDVGGVVERELVAASELGDQVALVGWCGVEDGSSSARGRRAPR